MSFIPPIVCLPQMSTLGEFLDPVSFCQGEEKRKESEENTSTFSLCLHPPPPQPTEPKQNSPGRGKEKKYGQWRRKETRNDFIYIFSMIERKEGGKKRK